MAEVLLDTLGLARRLRERAGFSPEHAEEAAQAIADAFSGPVATHGDLIGLRSDVRADLATMRGGDDRALDGATRGDDRALDGAARGDG